MLCFPNCKINIGLYVTEKRKDGYHNLETVFYPLAIHDVLEVVPVATAPQLVITGKTVSGEKENNLVWKAYSLLQQHYPGQLPPLDIFLHKNIPMGAGLGGGSADAAYMLRLLNDYCKLNLNDETLAQYALQLGSDCPFFIYNTPQLAMGRGEKLTPVTLDLSAYSIQLICPQLHIATSGAFAKLKPKPAGFDLNKLPSLPIEEWKDNISNDFEASVFEMHPILAELKQNFYRQGAVYASMSGSGSALYGIFEKGKQAGFSAFQAVAFEAFYIH